MVSFKRLAGWASAAAVLYVGPARQSYFVQLYARAIATDGCVSGECAEVVDSQTVACRRAIRCCKVVIQTLHCRTPTTPVGDSALSTQCVNGLWKHLEFIICSAVAHHMLAIN